jgi:hypothetical protein
MLAAMSAGTTSFGGTAVLGLPRTVLARAPNDAILRNMHIGGTLIEPSSLLSIRQLMVPSEEVGSAATALANGCFQQVEFVIAHECAHLVGYHFLARSAINIAGVLGAFHLWIRVAPRVPSRAGKVSLFYSCNLTV